MQKKEIPISYGLSTRKGKAVESEDGAKSAYDVAKLIMEEAKRMPGSDNMENFLKNLRAATALFRLVDKNKRTIEPDRCFYKAYILDQVQFLVARIDDLEIYGNQYCYARISYVDHETLYRGTVTFAVEDLYHYVDHGLKEDAPLYIIGTCIRKQHKQSAKYQCDKYSYQRVKVSDEKIFKRTKMLNYALINYL
jgi:hypothetical protein